MSLLSFIFIVLHGMHIYATHSLKGGNSKTNRGDLFLLTSLFCSKVHKGKVCGVTFLVITRSNKFGINFGALSVAN